MNWLQRLSSESTTTTDRSVCLPPLKSCRSSPPRSPPVWATGYSCSGRRGGVALDEVPQSGIARDFFLRGELGHPSDLVRLMPPLALYLAAHEQTAAAVRVLGAAGMATRESRSPEVHETIGLSARMRRMTGEIGPYEAAAIPSSLDEFLSLMRDLLITETNDAELSGS